METEKLISGTADTSTAPTPEPASLLAVARKDALTCVEWHFPLGRCTARLSIVADKGGEITPEDMIALADYAAAFEKQLSRREDARCQHEQERAFAARPNAA